MSSNSTSVSLMKVRTLVAICLGENAFRFNRFAQRSWMLLGRTASTAVPAWARTVRSTTCFRGRASPSMGWPTSCQPANSDKSNALPAVDTVTRVLARDRDLLDQIGLQVGWPVQYERVCRAARGLYRGSPEGAPTWQSRRTFTPLDLRFPEVPWIEYQFRHATTTPKTLSSGP